LHFDPILPFAFLKIGAKQMEQPPNTIPPKVTDWRNTPDPGPDLVDPDDELLEVTDPYVIQMLRFDPLDMPD